MSMYFLVYHTKPQAGLIDAEDIGGAYVSCWIEANSIDKADKIASEEIANAKWDILERDDAYEITEKDYLTDSDGFEFYQQALIDKWVLRFHTYPIE